MDVTNELSRYWNVDVEQMREAAERNTPREYPVRFCNVGEIFGKVKELCELLNLDPRKRFNVVGRLSDSDMEKLDRMYFISNNAGLYGSALLYPGVLEEIRKEVGEDYYVVPVSTESAVIHPITVDKTVPELREMLKDINETTRQPELKLSENIYLYNSVENELRIV